MLRFGEPLPWEQLDAHHIPLLWRLMFSNSTYESGAMTSMAE